MILSKNGWLISAFRLSQAQAAHQAQAVRQVQAVHQAQVTKVDRNRIE